MTTLATIRTGLATALDAVTGLSAYPEVPGQVNTPCAVVAPDSVEYDTTFEGGATYRLPVQFLVSLGDWGTAQRVLDAIVAHDGTGPTAVNGITTIEARVVGLEGYGLTTYGGVDYLGAQLLIEVLT